MQGITTRFAATGADAAVSITRRAVNHRIGLSLSFPRDHLDPGRLARALRLSFDAEPVVGCSFRTDERRPYWLRIPDLETAPLTVSEVASDPDAAIRAFQAIEVPDEGPQAAIALVRSAERDLLGIKLSHVLADGQAAKQYAYLLADIYNRLGSDPGYTPQPNLRARPTGRDVWANLTEEQRREARRAKSWASPTWPAPGKGDSVPCLTYRWTTLPPELFHALKSFGTARGCTVNDMMLTAVLRACIAHLDPPCAVPLSLMYTADLRRYLPETDSLPISNLSISGSLDIERVTDETFEETLRRVHERMQQWAEMCHGAGPLADAERLAGLGYRATRFLLGLALRAGAASDRTYPWFTNIGVIDETRLRFGGTAPDVAFMFGPAAVGASIVPVISTYRDVLTVSMGYGESTENTRFADALLASISTEIASACAIGPSTSATRRS